jgi:hypothetical protein
VYSQDTGVGSQARCSTAGSVILDIPSSRLIRCEYLPHVILDRTIADDVFEALSDPYRRQLLVALLAHNPQDDSDRDPLDTVADDIDPEVLEVEMVHNHLPKLEEMGFIEWDRGSDEISKGPNWGDIAPLLILIRDHQDELPDDWL